MLLDTIKKQYMVHDRLQSLENSVQLTNYILRALAHSGDRRAQEGVLVDTHEGRCAVRRLLDAVGFADSTCEAG